MNSLVKQFTWVLGIVLTLIGIAGFFVGDTLLIFHVNTIHNIVHVVSGLLALLAVSMGESVARLYLIVFGIVYALVTVLGFVMPNGDILGLFTVNDADNYLHAVIALGCLGVGLGVRK